MERRCSRKLGWTNLRLAAFAGTAFGVAVFAASLPSIAQNGQEIKNEDGSMFMEEVDTPKKKTKQAPAPQVDFGSLGVPVDPKGRIVPLIEPEAGPVLQNSSRMEIDYSPRTILVPGAYSPAPLYGTPGVNSAFANPYAPGFSPYGFRPYGAYGPGAYGPGAYGPYGPGAYGPGAFGRPGAYGGLYNSLFPFGGPGVYGATGGLGLGLGLGGYGGPGGLGYGGPGYYGGLGFANPGFYAPGAFGAPRMFGVPYGGYGVPAAGMPGSYPLPWNPQLNGTFAVPLGIPWSYSASSDDPSSQQSNYQSSGSYWNGFPSASVWSPNWRSPFSGSLFAPSITQFQQQGSIKSFFPKSLDGDDDQKTK